MGALFSIGERKQGFVGMVLLAILLISVTIYGLSNHEAEYIYQMNAFQKNIQRFEQQRMRIKMEILFFQKLMAVEQPLLKEQE